MKVTRLKNGQVKCVLRAEELNVPIIDLYSNQEDMQKVFSQVFSALKDFFVINEKHGDIQFQLDPPNPSFVTLYISTTSGEELIGKNPFTELANDIDRFLGEPIAPDKEEESEYELFLNTLKPRSEMNFDNLDLSEFTTSKNKHNRRPRPSMNFRVAFVVESMKNIFNAASALQKFKKLNNSLYFNEKRDLFILYIEKSLEDTDEFNTILSIMSEFGMRLLGEHSSRAFFEESYKPIIRRTALQDIFNHLNTQSKNLN